MSRTTNNHHHLHRHHNPRGDLADLQALLCIAGSVMEFGDVFDDTISSCRSLQSCFNIVSNFSSKFEGFQSQPEHVFERSLALMIALEARHPYGNDYKQNHVRFVWKKCAWDLLRKESSG